MDLDLTLRLPATTKLQCIWLCRPWEHDGFTLCRAVNLLKGHALRPGLYWVSLNEILKSIGVVSAHNLMQYKKVSVSTKTIELLLLIQLHKATDYIPTALAVSLLMTLSAVCFRLDLCLRLWVSGCGGWFRVVKRSQPRCVSHMFEATETGDPLRWISKWETWNELQHLGSVSQNRTSGLIWLWTAFLWISFERRPSNSEFNICTGSR